MDTIPKTQVRGHMMIRAKPQSGYALLGREFLQDRNLKGEARIVGAYLLSHPENFEVRVPHLAAHFGWNKDKIYRLLKSIITEGYGARRRIKGEAGQFGGVQYLICDCKREVADIKAQWAEEGNASIDDTPGEAEIVDEFEPSLALDEGHDGPPDAAEPCLAAPCTEKPDGDIIEKDNNLTPQSPPEPQQASRQSKPAIDWSNPDTTFSLMERRYDEAGKLNFAGKTQRAVKTWRKMTPDKRKQAWLVAPNWFKGKAAQIAKWHASPKKDRGRMPSYASLAEYLSLSLFEGVGLPVDPPPTVEAVEVPHELVEACWNSKLGIGSRFFVECGQPGHREWAEAWARVRASGIKNTFRNNDFLGFFPGADRGGWFCSQYPLGYIPLRPEEIDELAVARAS